MSRGLTASFLTAAVAATVLSSPAAGFQIASSFTEPCHEHMSLSALECVDGAAWGPGTVSCSGSAIFPPAFADVDPVAAGIGRQFAGRLGVTVDTDLEALIVLSLSAGCRYPDILEGSAYDIDTLRPLLLSDEHEHSHFIRRSYDDGLDGNASAAAAAIDFIGQQVALAIESSRRPLDERFVVHRVAVDFYGEVDVRLYEPLYRLGVALHTFEDSFAHALRTDDVKTVVSVMNSIEALSGTLDESRDGIAHSMAMDRCTEEAAPIAGVAALATGEFVSAVSDQAAGRGDGLVEAVMARWLGLQPGCDIGNSYCGTKWLELARQDPFMPIVEMAFGCQAGTAASGSFPSVMLMLVQLAVIAARRRR